MTTIVERNVPQDGGMSAALTAVVAIIGIVVIIGFVLYGLRMYPFNTITTTGSTPSTINVNVSSSVPAATPTTTNPY